MDRYLIQWNITSNCEYSCKYCYIDKSMNDLSEDEIYKAIKEICKLAELYEKVDINITGGNPLLSRNIDVVFKKLKKIANIEISILGNDVQLPNSIVSRNSERIKYYQFSYDGIVNQISSYREYSGDKHILRTIRDLRSSKIKTCLMMTLYKENMKSILNFLDSDIVKEVDSFSFSRIVWNSKIDRNSIISPYEFREFLYEYFEKLKKNKIENYFYKDPLWKLFFYENNYLDIEKTKICGCGVGINQFGILPNGDIVLCSKARVIIGNIIQNNIQEIIPIINIYHPSNHDKIYMACNECALFNVCRGCVAVTQSMINCSKDPQCWI
jgi:radical SAM protein with 4Fe4S-binding SPASM domain